jgi:hypothetical protein
MTAIVFLTAILWTAAAAVCLCPFRKAEEER